MAKALQAIAVMVQFAKVYWRLKDNFRSQTQYGNDKEIGELRQSLVSRSWLQAHHARVYPIADVTLYHKGDKPEDVIKECFAFRQAILDNLKAKGTPESAADYQVYERLWMVNGKLVVPEYLGNSAFRRATSVFAQAMLLRYKTDPKTAETEGRPYGMESIQTEIPVCIDKYADLAELIVTQQQENSLKDVGVKSVEPLDELRCVKALFDLGKNENFCRKIYKTTQSQKYYGVCRANVNWPKLNIFKRFYLPATDADSIPIKKVRHSEVVDLNHRAALMEMKSRGKQLTSEQQKKFNPVSEEEVAKYFSDLKTKESAGNDPKMMDKGDVKMISTNSPVNIFRKLATGVIDNNANNFLPYGEEEKAECINKLTDLLDTGKTVDCRKALFLAEHGPALIAALYSFLADSKGLPHVERFAKASASIDSVIKSTAVITIDPKPATVPAKVN